MFTSFMIHEVDVHGIKNILILVSLIMISVLKMSIIELFLFARYHIDYRLLGEELL